MKSVLPVRIPVYINTDIILNNRRIPGTIGNLSLDGVFIETAPTKTATPFVPGKSIGLEFKVSPRSIIKLNCEVIWLYTKKAKPYGVRNNMGMKIIGPSAKFKKYFNRL